MSASTPSFVSPASLKIPRTLDSITRNMARHDPVAPLPTTPANGLYRHYKGHLYEVTGIVRHSEELGPYVLYRCLDEHGKKFDDVLWIRPHTMWSEPVTYEGRTTPRFAPTSL